MSHFHLVGSVEQFRSLVLTTPDLQDNSSKQKAIDIVLAGASTDDGHINIMCACFLLGKAVWSETVLFSDMVKILHRMMDRSLLPVFGRYYSTDQAPVFDLDRLSRKPYPIDKPSVLVDRAKSIAVKG